MLAEYKTSARSERKATEVVQVWRRVEVIDPLWERGAMDAYGARKMQRTEASYLAGYLAQIEELPRDEKGVIEWFRYRPDGGWKLTDNI